MILMFCNIKKSLRICSINLKLNIIYVFNNSAPQVLPAALTLGCVWVENLGRGNLSISTPQTLLVLTAQTLPVDQLRCVE
jgi:hypothetical protein